MASIPPDPARKGHTRNVSSTDERRVAVPRRRTKGPLDFEENPPLKPTDPLSPIAGTPTTPAHPPNPMSPSDPTSAIARDFTYLRHPQNFHPLPSQVLLAPFRTSQPAPTTPLETLLSTGHFRAAAITAANALTDTSRQLSPSEIFKLWYIRLSSLTLIGSTPTAAQEIKVLSDLSSNFYREPETGTCMLPWELRVLAVRLQAIGFNDWRRSIGLYYELAREARMEILKETDAGVRTLWRRRLRDLGIRVGSALVEMGDLKAASRHLEGLRVDAGDAAGEEMIRGVLCLLYIRIGNMAAAKEVLSSSSTDPTSEYNDSVLKALFLMAEAKWESSVESWEKIISAAPEGEADMAKSNLAVCLLYTGKLEEARKVLETQISANIAFPGLTFNLSTIYELCSDNSKALKMQLAEKVAGMGREMISASFKM